MPTFDFVAIAERIRGLIGGQDAGDLATTAQRLGVPEFSLRMSIDRHAPTATLDVLAAIVNTYGVDPSWLLYGEYDSGSHRLAIETGQHLTPTDLLRVASHGHESPASASLRLEA